jgi:hypothetical protein
MGRGYQMGICAIVGLAVIGLAQQDGAKTVTMTARALPVGEIIRQVCNQTGLPLKVGNVALEPVIVKADAMPSKAFLESLASVLGAGWHKDGDSIILSREESDIFAADAARDAERKRDWAKGLEQTKANLKQNNDWSDAAIAKRMDQLRAQAKSILASQKQEGEGLPTIYTGTVGLPDNLIVSEAVSKLPLSAFTSIKAGERVIYSTQPNPLQQMLPYRPEAVGVYLDARARYLAAVKTLSRDRRFQWASGLAHEASTMGGSPKLVVRLSGQGGSYVNVECFLANAAGEVLSTSSTTVVPSNTFTTIHPGAKEKVVFGPDSLPLARVVATGNMHPSCREYDVAYPSFGWVFDKQAAKVVSILEDPVAHEPLSYCASDLFIGWATSVKKNIIAYVSDLSFARINQSCLSTNLRYDDILSYPANLGCTITVGDPILVRPMDIQSAIDNHVDRVALKRLIDKVHTVGYLRLADLAPYCATRVSQPGYVNLDYRWMSGISPIIANQLNSIDLRALRVCTSLGWSLDRLKDGNAHVDSVAMPKSVWAELADLARSGRFSLYVEGASDIQRMEPTEMYASLMSSEISLEASVSSMDIAYSIDANNLGRFLHAYQIGARKSMAMPPGYDMPRKFESYSLAKVRSLSMTIAAGVSNPSPTSSKPVQSYSRYGGVSLGQLVDLTATSNDHLTFDQLPQTFQTQVNASARSQINYYGGPGYQGRTIPPR